MRPPLPALLLLLALPCCAQVEDDARAAWLKGTILEDNRAFLEREPARVEEKLGRMALGPFPFLRGTHGQFVRDSFTAGSPGFLRSRFDTAAGSRVLLVGDPHPENLGSYLAGGRVALLDFDDFDAAAYGPWSLDLRRLAVGFELAALAAGLSAADARAVAEATALGYGREIERLAEGGAFLPVRAGEGRGAIVDDLLSRALRDGVARDELATYTTVEGEERFLATGWVEPYDETIPTTAAEQALVLSALQLWPRSLLQEMETGAVKGVSRRLGSGVSSLPNLRFYALLEGPTLSPGDDLLLELKEVRAPVALPLPAGTPRRMFADDGERVVRSARRLQAFADEDPFLGDALVQPLALVVRQRSGFRKGFSVERLAAKLASGSWSGTELRDFAAVAGGLLAAAHARAPAEDGSDSLPAIASALGGDHDGLAAEVAGWADLYAAQLVADHETFLALLAEQGPLLGWRAEHAR